MRRRIGDDPRHPPPARISGSGRKASSGDETNGRCQNGSMAASALLLISPSTETSRKRTMDLGEPVMQTCRGRVASSSKEDTNSKGQRSTPAQY
uniref:Uncharacterized protein n=1 Tax=Oryza rufipogon TaxID=4529 RepID=A0A0E0QAQ7_ORYRU